MDASVWRGWWGIPLLPADLNGKNVVELGCGTAYVSAWAARRGARRVVGIDNSARQLETARRLADEYGVDVTLHHGIAEDTPEPDDAFESRSASTAPCCGPNRPPSSPRRAGCCATAGRCCF
jgi:predicted RNA methylase